MPAAASADLHRVSRSVWLGGKASSFRTEQNAPQSSVHPASSTSVPSKFKVNAEVERIVARIWLTVGDLIMPGHTFDTSTDLITTANNPPRAKQMIAHLQSLSALSATPSSPPASSISTASGGVVATPTSQQILTAYLLLLLLTSAPHFSIPLNKAKDLLASKVRAGGSSVITGQGTTRIIYGCVAKRLEAHSTIDDSSKGTDS